MRCPCSRATVFALAGILTASAVATTRAYFVEPKTATSAWSSYGGYVAQSFVANVDSIYYLEWFVGDLSASGFYVFDVLETGTNRVVAHGDTLVPAHGWQWVRCDRFTQGNRCFTKGREYVVKVSHSGGDSEV